MCEINTSSPKRLVERRLDIKDAEQCVNKITDKGPITYNLCIWYVDLTVNLRNYIIRFFVEADFIWCSVGECAGGVVVFGVNNVVDGFSKQ